MAMVKLSGEIVEINGLFGGDVWRTDTCGQHVQKKPGLPGKDPSPRQRKVRRCFSKLHSLYWHKLAEPLRAVWVLYGKTHRMKNKKGEDIGWDGWSWFSHFNMPRCLKGLPPLLIPPG